jgi:hypothetical protein
MNAAISELCVRSKITEYLTTKGIRLIKSGAKWKCACPLHNERDPSMYIRTMPDGAEVFHCFGCGKSGNIITLISELENIKKGSVIRNLANKLNLTIGKYDVGEKCEPLRDEVLEFFCEEDERMTEISDWVLPFLKAHASEDSVNKVSRVYDKMDKLADVGNTEELEAIVGEMFKIITTYDGDESWNTKK